MPLVALPCKIPKHLSSLPYFSEENCSDEGFHRMKNFQKLYCSVIHFIFTLVTRCYENVKKTCVLSKRMRNNKGNDVRKCVQCTFCCQEQQKPRKRTRKRQQKLRPHWSWHVDGYRVDSRIPQGNNVIMVVD